MKIVILKNTCTSLFLLFLSIQNYAQGQSVRYICYKKSVCNTQLVQIKRYTLSCGGITFIADDSGVCHIAKLGTYTFYSVELTTGVELHKVQFALFGNFEDIIQSLELYPVIMVDGNSKKLKTGDWVYCAKKCNGYKIDYYKNGKKRIEGKFKKGKPVGELKFYNENGKFKYIEYYNKRGKKYKSERFKN